MSPSRLGGHRVLVTGGSGFLGQHVLDRLPAAGPDAVFAPSRAECDLTRDGDVEAVFGDFRPTVVLHLAAESGSLGSHRARPGRHCWSNLAMGLHVLEHARRVHAGCVILAGAATAYPDSAPVPLQEDSLFEGLPEETVAPFAVAKRSQLTLLEAFHREFGIRGCQLQITSLYGTGRQGEHHRTEVIPSLVRRFVQAMENGTERVTLWGTGEATRDFLHVEDAAHGILLAAEHSGVPVPINLGTGLETPIHALARQVARIVGYDGLLDWDPRQPEGPRRRCVDLRRARTLLGFEPRHRLSEALPAAVEQWREILAQPAGMTD